ncbi:MAG: hypothetical protein JO040_13340 [Gemmatimonadetes bacterium]|nr:hypothetical protein [Gemmatimonadota bacterium]
MRIWSLVCVALTAACALTTQPSPALDEDFSVRLGESVSVDGGQLTVGLREVPEDSRCPTDVQCVRAGEAVVTLNLVRPGKQPSTLTLRTTPGKDVAAFDEYRVELRDVNPKPRTGGSPAETYVATLRVHRG